MPSMWSHTHRHTPHTQPHTHTHTHFDTHAATRTHPSTYALAVWSGVCGARCHPAAWSSGMILGLGPRGPGFNSRSGPFDIDGVHCTCVLGWSAGLACRGCVCTFRGSIVVSISACHAEDPGSIPGRGVLLSSGDARWCVCVCVCVLVVCACLLCQWLWP